MANVALPNQTSPNRSIDGVTGRLRRLRARVTRWFVVDGLAKITAALVLLIGFDLLLDWFFEMDRPQRIVMLGLIVACMGWMVWRYLIKPLRRNVSEDALCLQVERQNAQLGESLISALQFSRGSDYEARGVSNAMVVATIDKGISSAEGLTFEETLHSGRFVRNVLVLLVSVAALTGIVVAAQGSGVFGTWWKRNVLLDENTRWPQKTVFVVEGVDDGVLIVPKGDDWLLIARIDEKSEEKAEEATIEIRRGGRRRIEVMTAIEPAPKAAGGKKDAKAKPPTGPTGEGFHFTFQQVLEEFEFRIVSDSGRTEWIQVKLVDRPEVATLNLAVTEPAYAGGRVKQLKVGLDKHYVLKGSALQVSGTASKDLAGAVLVVGDRKLALQTDGSNFKLPVPTQIQADTTFEIRLIDKVKVQLPNQTKPTPLESQPHTAFEIKLREDTVPQVTLKLIGVGTMVIPNAQIPCVVDANDDFEISKVRLKYEWQDHSGAAPHTGSIKLDGLNKELAARNAEQNELLKPLYDKRDNLLKQQQGLAEDSNDYQQIAGELFGINAKIAEARNELRNLRFNYTLDLKPLKIPENSNLRIRFEIDDNDNVSGPKTGIATESLEVVSEATLRNRLLEREKRQRDILESKRDQQDELFTKTAEIMARVGDKKEVSEADRATLQKMQRSQQRMSREMKAVAEKLSAILAEYRNNRITAEEARLKARQEKIIDPLKKLVDKSVADAAKALMQARGNLADPKTRNDALKSASKEQSAIRDKLTDIIAQMSKAENFQKAVNKAYQVQKAQKQLLDQLNDFLKKQLNKLPKN